LKDKLHEPFESNHIKDFKSDDSIVESYPQNSFKKMDPEFWMEIRESKTSSVGNLFLI
jgi:hypothetical protein